MSLTICLNQTELCQTFGIGIRKELATKFAGLKFTFPANMSVLGLDTLGFTDYTFRDFTHIADEDLANLASIGMTNEKIRLIAHLGNYLAEKKYLGKYDNALESSLQELASQGIEMTVCASTSDMDQSRNLAFNHSRQRNSNNRRY